MTTKRAAIYLRSSKDRSDVSIDAQRRALHDLAMTKGVAIVQEFSDAVESGKDEDRPGFQTLLRALRDGNRGWSNVLVLDTSRIARRRHIALIFEHECEKQGIAIHYKNVPDADPITGMLLKSILQAMDEWHSLTSKAKGLAGMAENVRQGWRAGGRAPRGYALEHHPTGAIRDGSPVMKSKLVPNDDAPLVQKYLKARAKGERRINAMARLGVTWTQESLNGMEWQALTYAGHTVWNVHNERTTTGHKTGEKRKPRDQWLVKRNTHEALITDDEAETIIKNIEKRREIRSYERKRVYLLSGVLVSPDGQVWGGEWDSRMQAPLYRLGKGKKIVAARVDSAVVDAAIAELSSDSTASRIVAALQQRMTAPVDKRSIAGLEKKLANITTKVNKLIDFMTECDPGSLPAYQRAVTNMEAERAVILEQLEEINVKVETNTIAEEISVEQIKSLLMMVSDDMKAAVDSEDIVALKTALGSMIDRVVLDPVSQRCEILFSLAPPDSTGVTLASPRGTQFTPVLWSRVCVLPQRWESQRRVH